MGEEGGPAREHPVQARDEWLGAHLRPEREQDAALGRRQGADVGESGQRRQGRRRRPCGVAAAGTACGGSPACGRSPLRSRRKRPDSTRFTGLTRTKLSHTARIVASPAASTPQTRSASRAIGASRGTSTSATACQAAVWARPSAKTGCSAAQTHSSQPGREARWRWSEETYGDGPEPADLGVDGRDLAGGVALGELSQHGLR
jgi:hypothetical protein